MGKRICNAKHTRHIVLYPKRKALCCPVCRKNAISTISKSSTWECTYCGYRYPENMFEDGYGLWFCDECESYLNNQKGFDHRAEKHICCNCGCENIITIETTKSLCSTCGEILSDPSKNLCESCCQVRKNKAKKVGITVGKALVGVAAVIGGIIAITWASKAENEIDENCEDVSDEESRNKLDPVNFCRIFDMFGEEAAVQTLRDVNEGRISESTIEKYIYDESESKEEYAERLKRE